MVYFAIPVKSYQDFFQLSCIQRSYKIIGNSSFNRFKFLVR
ncbi:hypothetical protein H6H03_20730 [Nostoc paludosum FACHB-159]|uniref:Uncharacterized protein n=1 Tax=Nostoc paludosum FACHB-159 TaxID=2692908 RepID=A0ABR8KDB9_9NOSO|nr:hypothetical protein [Nostoc sp. FACHB-857]MBD2736290.1 hypothetical protein [Nostoc paludosum FACHB-159]